MVSKIPENLTHLFEFQHESPEDLVFNLFKLPQSEDASIGRLISVIIFCLIIKI